MVCSGTDDSNVDAVFLVPSRVSVHHINSVSGIEIVYRTFPVDFPDLKPKVLAVDRDKDVRKLVRGT